jgi:hypothetical protein
VAFHTTFGLENYFPSMEVSRAIVIVQKKEVTHQVPHFVHIEGGPEQRVFSKGIDESRAVIPKPG